MGNVLLGALLTALGMGFSLVPATIVAMSGVPGSQSGLASGVLNTSRLMGGALGLAILSTIAAGRTRAETGLGAARALTDGFDRAFVVGTGFALVAVLLAVVSLRSESEEFAAEPVPVRVAEAEAAEADAEDREPVLA